MLLVLLFLALAPMAYGQGAGEVSVSSVAELRAALQGKTARSIAVLTNLIFSEEDWPEPVLVTRAVTVYSPYRVKLDFCGSAGAPARVLINVSSTGSLLLQRVFLRNFLPSAPQDLTGLGPVPALLSSGGLISFRLVVFHFLPAVTWVFSAHPERSFWAREQRGVMGEISNGTPLRLDAPQLYLLKYDSSQYSILTSYSPVDVRGCYGDDREDTTLVYCLYTLADSLRNPHVTHARVFHNIGLDRVSYNRLNPIRVAGPKSYAACPGAVPSINMDSVLSGIEVRTAVEFAGIRFRGSLPTSYTTWPPSLPLLLSAFEVDGPGSVSLVNCSVEVADLTALVGVLRALPGCCSADPARPNLQPNVDAWPSLPDLVVASALATLPSNATTSGSANSGSGGYIIDAWNATSSSVAAAAGVPSMPGFTITDWVLPKNSWLLYSALNAYETLSAPSAAAWRFVNVRVEQGDEGNARTLCFGAPLEQGVMLRGQAARVGSDVELRAALARSARFIQIVSDITFNPANWPSGSSALLLDAGVVEVRGCHPVPGRRFTIDLARLTSVVRCSGRLMWQGDLLFARPGWDALPAGQVLAVAAGLQDMSLLTAFAVEPNLAGGSGSVELERVRVEGRLDASAAGLRPSDLLTVLHLNHVTPLLRALNVSMYGQSAVMLGLWTVPEAATQLGLWAFTHVNVSWDATPTATGAGGGGRAGGARVRVLSIALPVALCGAVLVAGIAAGAALLLARRRRRPGDGGGGGGCWPSRKLPYATPAAASGAPTAAGGAVINGGAGAAANGNGVVNGQLKGACEFVSDPLHQGSCFHRRSGDPYDPANNGAACTLGTAPADPEKAAAGGPGQRPGNSASETRTDEMGSYVIGGPPMQANGQGRPGGGGGGGGRGAVATGVAGRPMSPFRGPPSEVSMAERGRGGQSGPLGDIDAAKRAIAAGRGAPGPGSDDPLDDLVLLNVLGEGSYGRVYRALWRGTSVAVKVILLPAHMSGRERHERMAVMEAAISSSLSHPNIVQTYTYTVGRVEGAKGRAGSMRLRGTGTDGSSLPGSSTAPVGGAAGAPGADAAADVGAAADGDILGWEIRLVQEYCDLGSLRDKLNARAFFRTARSTSAAGSAAPTPTAGSVGPAVLASPPEASAAEPPPTPAGVGGGAYGAAGGGSAAADVAAGDAPPGEGEFPGVDPYASVEVDLAAVLDTAIDVARAVAHLHREGIVHADLKPRNVLLKGSTTDPRGFVAKVADFGLSMRLDTHETHVSNAFHGTLAYMAPETLLHGHVSRPSDVYGFGILLYELYTGETAFRGVPKALIGHAIAKDNLRPVFPPALAAPFEYQLLACRCWESNPEIRPEFDFILDDLKRLRNRLCAPQHPAQYGGPGAAGGSSSGRAGAFHATSHRATHRTGDFTRDFTAGRSLSPAHSASGSSAGASSTMSALSAVAGPPATAPASTACASDAALLSGGMASPRGEGAAGAGAAHAPDGYGAQAAAAPPCSSVDEEQVAPQSL